MPMDKKTFIAVIILSIVLTSLFGNFSSYCLIQATPEDSWTQKAPMLSARGGFGLAVVGSKIYAIGGTDGHTGYHWIASNEEYDTTTDNWTEKALMPTARAYSAIASYQGKVYVIGGLAGRTNDTSEGVPSAVNEVYDPLTNSWETKSPLPVPRMRITASAVNGKIYVFGGASGGTREMFVYDVATDTWSTKPSIYESNFFTSSLVLDNKIYVYTSGLYYLLIYDVATDTWKQSQSYSIRLSSSAFAATTGTTATKRIYVIGGEKTGVLDLLSSNRIYHPEADSWTFGSDLPTALSDAVAAVFNDSIYVMGGTQTSYPYQSYLKQNLQYTPLSYDPSDLPSQSPSPNPSETANTTLTASLAESASAIYFGEKVNFTVAVDNGREPYTYAWYVDNHLMGTIASPELFLDTSPVGSHHVYVQVTDADNNTATTLTVEFNVLPTPSSSSGSSSSPSPTQQPTQSPMPSTEPNSETINPYIILISILIAVVAVIAALVYVKRHKRNPDKP
jgi:N-acetylneuraminic acid mutarotase